MRERYIIMSTLTNWPTQRTPWLLLAVSALLLELSALYFQYGLKLEP
ncbi:MAG: disulfide bond formation protein DsbB, partial [Alteromonadaceae bacterium]